MIIEMNYPLVYGHLGTIVPGFILGTYLMFSKKGTPAHKLTGKVYLTLMFISATISLFMPAFVGPQWLNHFGFIHLFSVLTIASVPIALKAARDGNMPLHIGSMIGLYVGGLLIAGGFAFMPGRMLNRWLFN